MEKSTTERCPVYKKCGGCQLDTAYPEQLGFKQRKVERLLRRFCKVAPIIGMDKPCHYRNKVQAAFYTNRSGKIISGVYQSGTHHVVGIDSCMIEDKTADRIIVAVRKLLPSFKLTTYNEDTGRGFLRHVLVRRGFSTNEIMLVLVTGTPVFPSKNNFVKAILKQFPEITTIVQNVNNLSTNLVLGDRQNVLYGKGYIEDVLCGCRFRISPKSFYQINPVQTGVLYGKAIEFAQLRGDETVLDTYCGIGTIGIVAAKNGASRAQRRRRPRRDNKRQAQQSEKYPLLQGRRGRIHGIRRRRGRSSLRCVHGSAESGQQREISALTDKNVAQKGRLRKLQSRNLSARPALSHR